MNLTDELFGSTWLIGAWLVFAVCLYACVRTAPWRKLHSSRRLNLWLASMVVLTLVWQMKAGVRPGMELHLLGATVLTLMVGPHLAMLGLCLVLLFSSLNAWQQSGPLVLYSYALNALLLAVAPVLTAQWLLRQVERRLPQNFFIYLFCAAFFGAALVILVVGVLATTLLWLGGVYPAALLLREFLPFFMLLAFSEAWLTGGAITLMAVYAPLWLDSFDDRRYIFNK